MGLPITGPRTTRTMSMVVIISTGATASEGVALVPAVPQIERLAPVGLCCMLLKHDIDPAQY